ncbi:hypothetical protein JL107_16370 [Nakamurella flavida]|uniref:Uncharacterized protein n=1 Tax=Nakamurella flavida TaxID=363630 RepID=A0A938YHY9_9ACTN|nr:hypothetical protein [Nakamurella flavida]MBM9478025.1 hypothetical protein [Nakamurella flavida]MDP9778258.1 2-polyprenyl-6-methoxyphenol hydroxylase-like FAD-dependent oxidoreductase [Nakamurella flavida]
MQRVIVIGASLAGLLAAAGISDAGGANRPVTVLDRDPTPVDGTARPGVPQGRQPHVLLRRGLLALQELLPDLRPALLARGAVPLDTGDLAWRDVTGWALHGEPAHEILSLTRPLLEAVVAEQVGALPGVTIRRGAAVTDLRRVGRSWQIRLDDGSTLTADVVVDASGRSSRLPQWLAGMGVGPADETVVDARLGYSCRLYAGGPDPRELAGVVVLSDPTLPKGGIGLPVENGGWIIAATGTGDCRPPRDEAEFDAYLTGLRDPALADLAASCTGGGPVAVHRQTANRRRAYDQVPHWPAGLLPVGDAMCAFNPVYGQGITVAALQATTLRREWPARMDPAATRKLLSRLTSTTALPWAMAVGEDLRFPTTPGSQGLVQQLTGAWAREVGRLGVHGDRRATRALTTTYHLMGSPLAMLDPRLVLRAGLDLVGVRGAPNPRPAVLETLVEPAHAPAG